jgi:hypothetical protein
MSIKGDIFRSGHQSFVRGVLNETDVTVESKGDRFYNENDFPVLYWMMTFLENHPHGEPINRADIKRYARKAKEEMNGANRIVIASTPKKVDREIRNRLDGGLIHEALHSICTERGRDLDIDRLEEIMKEHYDPDVSYGRKAKMLKGIWNIFEDTYIERKGVDMFKGASAKLQSVQELVWEMEEEGRRGENPQTAWRPIDHVIQYIRDKCQDTYIHGAPFDEYEDDAKKIVDKHFSHIIEKAQQTESTYDTMSLAFETLNILDNVSNHQPPQQMPPMQAPSGGDGEDEESQQQQQKQDDSENQDSDGESKSIKVETDEEEGENSGSGSEDGDEKEKREDESGSAGSGDDSEKGEEGEEDEQSGGGGTSQQEEERDEDEEEGGSSSSGDENENHQKEREENGGDDQEGESEDEDGEEESDQDKGESEEDGNSEEAENEDEGEDEELEQLKKELEEETETSTEEDQVQDALQQMYEDEMEQRSFDFPMPFTEKHDKMMEVEANRAALRKFKKERDIVKSQIQYLRPKMLKILRGEKKSRLRHGRKKGKRLSSRTVSSVVYDDDPTPFVQKEKNEKKNSCVQFLLDESGSMSNYGRLEKAQRMLITLALTIGELQIPHEIIGFTDRRGVNPLKREYGKDWYDRVKSVKRQFSRFLACEYRKFRSFDDPFNPESYKKLVQTRAKGCTPLPDAIQMGARRIVQRDEDQKIMILVTDGKPEYHDESKLNTRDYVQMMKNQEQDLQQAGIHLMVIGIGNHLNYVSEFENSIEFESTKNISQKMTKFLHEQMKQVKKIQNNS